jgi:hypothetical protein
MFECAIDLKESGSVFFIKGSLHYLTASELQKVKDLSYMRGPGYDSDLGVSKTFENFIRDMVGAIVHQKYLIFIGKFLESSQFVEIGKDHGANITEEKFCHNVGF